MSNAVTFLGVVVVMGLLFPVQIAFSGAGPDLEPASSQATHDAIRVRGDADFTEENGVVAGSGIPSEPFVIEGWIINASARNGIDIRGTDAWFLIRDVVVFAFPPRWAGIHLEDVSNGTVEGVELMGTAPGIALIDSANITVSNNHVVSNGEWSILSDRSSNVSISGNRISEGSGVFLFNSTNLRFVGNLVSSTQTEAFIAWGTDNLTLESNSVWENELGFYLIEVSNASVKTNHIWDNRLGIMLQDSRYVRLESNGLVGSGIILEGNELEHFRTNEISVTNSVNGRPVYFYRDCSDQVLEDRPAGQVFILSCRNVQVRDVRLEDVDVGIQVAFAEDVTLSGINVSNAWRGVRADHSRNLSIQNSALWNNEAGFSLRATSNVTLTGNRISGNAVGGRVFRSANITIVRNTFSHSSEVGLELYGVSQIRVFHNDFVDNFVHGHAQDDSQTVWDGGYPEGGNYWSDYDGVDRCSGPAQDTCPDPDGLGDAAYVIDLFYPYDDIRDRYPLVEPVDPRNTVPEDIVPLPLYPIFAAVAVVATLVVTTLVLLRRKATGSAGSWGKDRFP